MSTEGVKLSGASRAGATVNGSTLWRHPDMTSRGPKVQHVHSYVQESLRQADREAIMLSKSVIVYAYPVQPNDI